MALVGWLGYSSTRVRIDEHVTIASLADRSARGEGTLVPFDSLVPGEWDRMWLFGPYSDTARVHRCVGVSVSPAQLHDIEMRDDRTLLVFRFPSRGLASLAVPRKVAEFRDAPSGSSFARAAARFVVRSDSTGRSAAFTPTVAGDPCPPAPAG